MTQQFIIDVSEMDFEYEVLTYSQNVPVIVDFWAEWCRPCKTLSPILERLAIEAYGAFRLAKVDVDANPNLALRYSVRSIPTVKTFIQGEVVSEFVGILPENRIRDFLSKISPPNATNLAIEKAQSMLGENQWAEAESSFRELLQQNPDSPECLIGLLKSLLGQGITQESMEIIRNFPSNKYFNQAMNLKPLAEQIKAYQSDLLPDANDLDIMFQNSIRLASKGNQLAALDGLFELLRQDKSYLDGMPKKIALAILELMGEGNPDTRQYRSELASILF